MGTGRGVQWVLYLSLFQVMLGFGVVVPILPYFAQELGASSFQMGLTITVWAGAQFLFSPFWGSLSDRVGRRPILLIGLTGYSITFGLMAAAPNIWVVMLARFLGGILSAATIPTAQAYAADVSEGEDRTARIAGMGAAMNLGFMSGPSLGGLLAALGLGYRGSFLAAAAMGLLNLLLALLILPEPPHRRFSSTKKGFSGLQAVGVALTSAEALLFVLAFAASFSGSQMFSMLGYFLEERLQVGLGVLSVALTVQAVSSFLFQAILVGPLSRWFQPEKIVSAALVVTSLGFGLLATATSIPHVLGAVVVIAAGLAFVRPLITAILSSRTRLDQGMAMGIQVAFDALGRTLGPAWAGAVFLWRSWAPFASAGAACLLFFAITWWAWHRPRPVLQHSAIPNEKPPAG